MAPSLTVPARVSQPVYFINTASFKTFNFTRNCPSKSQFTDRVRVNREQIREIVHSAEIGDPRLFVQLVRKHAPPRCICNGCAATNNNNVSLGDDAGIASRKILATDNSFGHTAENAGHRSQTQTNIGETAIILRLSAQSSY